MLTANMQPVTGLKPRVSLLKKVTPSLPSILENGTSLEQHVSMELGVGTGRQAAPAALGPAVAVTHL